jgi:hypothetical protein
VRRDLWYPSEIGFAVFHLEIGRAGANEILTVA